jgi:hypothetical protein
MTSVGDGQDIAATAHDFFDTCNGGSGWEVCCRWSQTGLHLLVPGLTLDIGGAGTIF